MKYSNIKFAVLTVECDNIQKRKSPYLLLGIYESRILPKKPRYLKKVLCKEYPGSKSPEREICKQKNKGVIVAMKTMNDPRYVEDIVNELHEKYEGLYEPFISDNKKIHPEVTEAAWGEIRLPTFIQDKILEEYFGLPPEKKEN